MALIDWDGHFLSNSFYLIYHLTMLNMVEIAYSNFAFGWEQLHFTVTGKEVQYRCFANLLLKMVLWLLCTCITEILATVHGKGQNNIYQVKQFPLRLSVASVSQKVHTHWHWQECHIFQIHSGVKNDTIINIKIFLLGLVAPVRLETNNPVSRTGPWTAPCTWYSKDFQTPQHR